MNAKDRCIPFVYKLVRRVGKCVLSYRILFFPVCTTHIPVGKPFLFCFQILHFHVEDAIMCNECFEALVMMSGEPVNGETTEAGTYTTETVFVYKRFFSHLVDSCKIILHTLTTVITTDGFIPFHSKARKSAAVGSYDDIVVGSHNLEIPAIAPELTYGALRTTFTEQEGRVFLIRVKLWRVDNPCQHLFTVCSFHPASFNLSHFQLVVNLFVFEGQLFCFGKSIPVVGGRYGIDFITHTH